jgi:hypothetical protein
MLQQFLKMLKHFYHQRPTFLFLLLQWWWRVGTRRVFNPHIGAQGKP